MDDSTKIETDHGEIYSPKTQRDCELVLERVAAGDSPASILKSLRDPKWRSETTELGGHLFCAACDQIITAKECSECGQALLGTLPTLLDLIPVPHGSRTFLLDIAAHLLSHFVKPALTLQILQALNKVQSPRCLDPIAIEMLFNEAVQIELRRRQGLVA